ncbi:hypothetical protein OROHE_002713 [Orobanche hederae]
MCGHISHKLNTEVVMSAAMVRNDEVIIIITAQPRTKASSCFITR